MANDNLPNDQYEFDMNPEYGLAGFDELLDVLQVRTIPDRVARYILGAIARHTFEKPITAEQLLINTNERLHTDYNPKKDAVVRKIVSYCSCEKGLPVASCSRGYYRARRAEELDPTIQHLERRLKRITHRLDQARHLKRCMEQNEAKLATQEY